MAGENKVQGAVSFTPIVHVTGADDADAFDTIQHDIKGSLGGEMIYSATDGADRWFYTTTRDIVAAHADLIAGNFTDAAVAVHVNDKVKFLFIKNTGTTDGSTATDSKVYLTLDGGDGAATDDTIEIGAGEAFQVKFKNLTVQLLHAATSSGTVRCTVAAMIDDV